MWHTKGNILLYLQIEAKRNCDVLVKGEICWNSILHELFFKFFFTVQYKAQGIL